MQFRPGRAAIGLGSGSDPGWIRNPFDHRFAVKHADPARIQVGSNCPRSADCAKMLIIAAKMHRIRLDPKLVQFGSDQVRFHVGSPPFDQRAVRKCAGRVRKTRKFVRIRLGSRLDPIAPDQPIVQKRQYSLQHAWDLEDSRTRLVLLGSSSDSRWIQPSFD